MIDIQKPRLTNIDDLGFSQIYLSEEKIAGVMSWFQPSLANFEPVPVRDFLGNGKLTLTDGHTRTYVAWTQGLSQIPTVYDDDEIVTSRLGHELYCHDIVWCERLGIRHVSDFSSRILPAEIYKTLWDRRCDLLFNMITAIQNGKISRDKLEQKQAHLSKKGLYLYGLSSDLSIAYCENSRGDLFQIAIT